MKRTLSFLAVFAMLLCCLNFPATAEENYEKLDVRFMQAYATASARTRFNYGTEKVIDGMTDSGKFVNDVSGEYKSGTGGGPYDWIQPYIVVNLGGTYEIGNIRLNYLRNETLAYLYGIQYSTDGYNWTNLKGYFAMNNADPGVFEWNAGGVKAAYIKVVSMNGGTFGLTEIEVYGKKSEAAEDTTLIRPERIKVYSSSNSAVTKIKGNYINGEEREFIATGNPKVVLDDDLYRTYWTSSDNGAGTDDWISFDLSRSYTLSSAVINYIGTPGYNMDIYTSNDGENWDVLKTHTCSSADPIDHQVFNGRRTFIDLNGIRTRYIKFQKSSVISGGTDEWKIGNIFFNTKDAEYASLIRHTDKSLWDLSASTNKAYTIDTTRSATDDNLQTQIWSFGKNGYVNIDMGKICNISQVILQGGWWYGQSPINGTVAVSDDGVSFDTVAEFDMLDGIYANTVLSFDPVNTRYVRIYNPEWYNWRVAEVNIYGSELIDDAQFYLVDGENIRNLSYMQNGTVRVKKSVQMSSDTPVTFIAALYSGSDNSLAQVNLQTKACSGKAAEFSVDLDLSEDKVGAIEDPSQYYIKTYLWDMEDMLPLADNEEYRSKQNVTRNTDFVVNVPAESLGLLITGDENVSEIERITQQYYAGLLQGTPVGRIFLNLNYARSFTDSDTWDSLAWNINLGDDGNPILDSDGNVTKTASPDMTEATSNFCRMQKLQRRGIDVYAIGIDEIKDFGAEAWISFRMNDHHYRTDKGFKSAFIQNHPEYALSNFEENEYFDFSKEAVRTYYKNYILEMCEKYDVDGVELDWLRTPQLFNPVTDDSRQLLNDYMKELRAGIDKIAESKGKSIKIAVRGYSNESQNLASGLNLAQWIADGSADVLTVMDFYMPTNYDIPVQSWKDSIAKKNDKADYRIYAGADCTVSCDLTGGSNYMYINEEQLKGFASSAYNRGSDGIYLFNNNMKQETPAGVTYEIGANGWLEEVNESYYSTYSSIGSKQAAESGLRRYVKTSGVTYPIDITDNSSISVNTGTAVNSGYYVIAVGLADNDGYTDTVLSVSVNGGTTEQISDIPTSDYCKYSPSNAKLLKNIAQTAPRVARFKVTDLSCIKDGDNVITITNNSGKTQTVKWFEVFADNTEGAKPIGE